MTDSAKPSPETSAELPADVVKLLDDYWHTVSMSERRPAHAALVARLIEWGEERFKAGSDEGYNARVYQELHP